MFVFKSLVVQVCYLVGVMLVMALCGLTVVIIVLPNSN